MNSMVLLCRRPKLTRNAFKNYFHKFWAEGGKAEAVAMGPGPLCFVVIHAKDSEQVLVRCLWADAASQLLGNTITSVLDDIALSEPH